MIRSWKQYDPFFGQGNPLERSGWWTSSSSYTHWVIKNMILPKVLMTSSGYPGLVLIFEDDVIVILANRIIPWKISCRRRRWWWRHRHHHICKRLYFSAGGYYELSGRERSWWWCSTWLKKWKSSSASKDKVIIMITQKEVRRILRNVGSRNIMMMLITKTWSCARKLCRWQISLSKVMMIISMILSHRVILNIMMLAMLEYHDADKVRISWWWWCFQGRLTGKAH